MKQLDPTIIVPLFLKNFFGTVYIIPLWFLAVFLFETTRTHPSDPFFQNVVILSFYGAGWIVFVALIVGCYYWAWLTFTNFTYALQNDGLHIHKGVIFKKEILIPYADIDQVEVLVNPLTAKLFHVYTVAITTHDVANTEGILRKKQRQVLPGISPNDATYLRSELLKDSHIQPLKRTFFDPTTGRYH